MSYLFINTRTNLFVPLFKQIMRTNYIILGILILYTNGYVYTYVCKPTDIYTYINTPNGLSSICVTLYNQLHKTLIDQYMSGSIILKKVYLIGGKVILVNWFQTVRLFKTRHSK